MHHRSQSITSFRYKVSVLRYTIFAPGLETCASWSSHGPEGNPVDKHVDSSDSDQVNETHCLIQGAMHGV